jgi:hypothetical protein
MARPAKAAAKTRNNRITFRTTPDEQARIDARAAQAGMVRSDFVRHMALTGKVTVKQKKHPNFQLIHELNKIGVNLNQLVHAAHIRGKLPDSIHAICNEIERLVDQAAGEVDAE